MQWDYLLNDPLKRDKTKGMTNPKITPFLMCSATFADALGGTPAANDAGGEHIKKDPWISAHDAALAGLGHLLGSSEGGHSSRLVVGQAHDALDASRLGSQRATTKGCELDLSLVRGEVPPAANGRLLDLKQARNSSLRSKMIDCVLCFHPRQ